MSNETSRSCLIIHITFSIICILSGIIGIIVLALNKEDFSSHRYASLAYAGLSSVIGMWNLVLHTMHFQDIWRTWLKGLRLFMCLGVIFSMVSILSFIIFLIVASINKEEMSSNSFYVTAIWCSWSFVLSVLLLLYARRYRSEYADLTALLDF